MPIGSTPPQNNFNQDAERVEMIIAQTMGESFGRGAHARQKVLTDVEDARNVVIAILLKYDNDDINKFVNKKREERGLERLPKRIDRRDIYEFRKAYAQLIDEAYINVATYIGDIYPFADKLKRIGSINSLIELLAPQVQNELATFSDDMTIKKGNLMVKLFDRMNAEMGNKTMADFLIPREKKFKERLEEPEEDVPLTSEDIAKAIEARYATQLPDGVSISSKYTDYWNCAMGEKLGDKMVCWNDNMAATIKEKAGCQCLVQSGNIKRCPKFLNLSLLNDPAWCLRVREDIRLSHVEIAKILGVDSIDNDVRDRITYYFKKHGIEIKMPLAGNPNYLKNGTSGHTIHESDGNSEGDASSNTDSEATESNRPEDRETGS